MKFFEKHKIPLLIMLICFSLLELAIIIYTACTQGLTTVPAITQNTFAFVTAIICSIFASAIMLFIPNNNGDNQNIDIESIVKAAINNLPADRAPMTYEDTNDPHVDFNNRLNQGIQSSKRYIYFSDRALYLAKRLGKEITRHDSRLELYIFLADIREDSIFRSRKDMYTKREKANARATGNGSLRSLDEIIINEKMEVLRSLYAFSKLNDRYELHIYLHREIPFIRFELTDNLTVLTFLTQWTSGKKYPSTLLFENNSLFNANFSDYADQIRNRSECVDVDKIDIPYLRNLAKEAHLPDFNDSELTDYYEKKVK